MATRQDITISEGATFSQALTVSDTTGKTYVAKVVDNHWCHVIDLTCTITNATTVTISLMATQTNEMRKPNNLSFDERTAQLGYWDITETSGATVTRTHEGIVTYSQGAV